MAAPSASPPTATPRCSTCCATISASSAPNSAAALEQCGCCMVLVDGKPEKSCGKALSTVAGKAVLTIEGLGTPERPHPLQQAFLDEQAGQCGYCLSGILISAKALLDRNPSPIARARSPRRSTTISAAAAAIRASCAPSNAPPRACAREPRDERSQRRPCRRCSPPIRASTTGSGFPTPGRVAGRRPAGSRSARAS